jgi:hypothetical protein
MGSVEEGLIRRGGTRLDQLSRNGTRRGGTESGDEGRDGMRRDGTR